MEVATEFLTLGMIKVEDWLETMSIFVSDLLPDETSLTVLSNNSRYNMSLLAEWFHMIPRIDIHFRQLPANVTFDPSDNEYLESLGILVALPGIWLILTLLFFLIFFLCRCCDGSGGSTEQQKQLNQQHQQISVGKTLKPKSLTGCKVCLVMMTTITLLVIIASLFGSIIAHRGMIKVRNSADDVSVVLETVQNDTRTVVNMMRDQVDVKIENFKQAFERSLVHDPSSNMRAQFHESFFHLKKNVTKCNVYDVCKLPNLMNVFIFLGKKRMEEIYSRVNRLNLRPIPDTIDFAERIRWLSTFVFGVLLIIFCFILFCGIGHSSRCTLILFSVFGLLTLVVGWVLTSFYFGVMIAGSDFCAEPETFLADRLSSSMELALFDYYVKCSSPNPFNRQAKDSISTVENAHDVVRKIEMNCISNCQKDEQKFVSPQVQNIVEDLKTAENYMRRVQGMLDCSRIHEDYAYAMSAFCKDAMDGSFILLVTSAVIGFLFTVMVLCSSHTWIHLRPIKNNTQGGANNSIGGHSNTSALLANLDNDESEPFLSSTPHHANTLHHPTLFSNNSISSSVTNTSVGNKRFRDSYMSAYGTTGRGR